MRFFKLLPVQRFMADYDDDIADFHSLILDDTKCLSNAIFAHEDEPSEAAHIRKMDRAISLLTNIDENSHVLDIGEAWGTLAARLAKQKGCRVSRQLPVSVYL